ncbi:MAG: LemA family protein [Bdellovibrionales bacterium]
MKSIVIFALIIVVFIGGLSISIVSIAADNTSAISQAETSRIEKERQEKLEETKRKQVRSQNMGKFNSLAWVIVFAAFIFIPGVLTVITYNGLVSKAEETEEQWSQVKVALQRRFDLIPQLVSTVKSAAQHEEKFFSQITTARESLSKALASTNSKSDNLQQIAKGERELNDMLRSVYALSESNPQLKANESFMMLQDQLEGAENRISLERQRFNTAVKEYNRSIKSFPGNLLSSFLKLEESQYFESDLGAGIPPKMGL